MLVPLPTKIKNIKGWKCDSAVLELQKFPRLPDDGKSPQYDEINDFCKKLNSAKSKFTGKTFSASAAIDDDMYYCMELISGGRLLVNHSGGLIENSNLCLHRLFGFPQIPGSALKGIARAYAAIDDQADKEQLKRVFGSAKDENDKDKDQKTKAEDNQGNIIFFPAEPTDNNWEMVADVLSSHGGCDTKNPVPVFFPAVESGAKFRFILRKRNKSVPDEDLDYAANMLYGALTTYGAGAKTSAGYGWFEEAEDDGE